MRVAVAERRHQEAACEVDFVGSGRRRPGLLAHRAHHPVDDKQRIGVTGRAGPDHAAGEQGGGHPRDPTPEAILGEVI